MSPRTLAARRGCLGIEPVRRCLSFRKTSWRSTGPRRVAIDASPLSDDDVRWQALPRQHAACGSQCTARRGTRLLDATRLTLACMYSHPPNGARTGPRAGIGSRGRLPIDTASRTSIVAASDGFESRSIARAVPVAPTIAQRVPPLLWYDGPAPVTRQHAQWASWPGDLDRVLRTGSQRAKVLFLCYKNSDCFGRAGCFAQPWCFT